MPPRRRLIALLQLAYSGELAAAHAYRGHAASVRDPEERARIREIEQEEWHHRRLVGEMLAELGARPARWRELRASAIGRTLGFACRLAGWFAPMYGAWRLERRNVREYSTAARLALECDCGRFVDRLRAMAEVEIEHERWFLGKAAGHPIGRALRLSASATVPAARPTSAAGPIRGG